MAPLKQNDTVIPAPGFEHLKSFFGNTKGVVIASSFTNMLPREWYCTVSVGLEMKQFYQNALQKV